MDWELKQNMNNIKEITNKIMNTLQGNLQLYKTLHNLYKNVQTSELKNKRQN